jgi:hypothetical protein
MDLYNLLSRGISPGLESGLQHLSSMAGGGSPEFWQQLEAPALRQFGQMQGSRASRFSGMGSGARRSSGFQNVMGGAASDLAERLQSNRMSMQQQAIKDLMGMSQTLLGTDLMDTQFLAKQKPFWKEFLGAMAPGIGQGMGMAGGGWGLKSLGLI